MVRFIRKWRHFLAHLFRLNYGVVVTKTDDTGHIWIGLQCIDCERIDGKHISD
jgi:hypothetical protein